MQQITRKRCFIWWWKCSQQLAQAVRIPTPVCQTIHLSSFLIRWIFFFHFLFYCCYSNCCCYSWNANAFELEKRTKEKRLNSRLCSHSHMSLKMWRNLYPGSFDPINWKALRFVLCVTNLWCEKVYRDFCSTFCSVYICRWMNERKALFSIHSFESKRMIVAIVACLMFNSNNKLRRKPMSDWRNKIMMLNAVRSSKWTHIYLFGLIIVLKRTEFDFIIRFWVMEICSSIYIYIVIRSCRLSSFSFNKSEQ